MLRPGWYSYYYCGARWKPRPDGEKCESRGYNVQVLEVAVFETVSRFLREPESFETELRRRIGLPKATEDSFRREYADLRRSEKEEKEAEAKLLRQASRTMISDDVFDQELGLIRTRRQYLEGQKERLERQLADLEHHTFDPAAVTELRRRLESRLAAASPEDRRFVLEAIGASALAQSDGNWELEIHVPTEVSQQMQIVNSRPGSNYTMNTNSPFCSRPSGDRVQRPVRLWDACPA